MCANFWETSTLLLCHLVVESAVPFFSAGCITSAVVTMSGHAVSHCTVAKEYVTLACLHLCIRLFIHLCVLFSVVLSFTHPFTR